MKDKEKLKQKQKEYYLKNKEKISAKNKLKYEKDKEKIIESVKKYYELNRSEIIKKKKVYRDNNKEIIKEKRNISEAFRKDEIKKRKNEYVKNRVKTDKLFKVRVNVSSLIRETFKNKKFKKNTKTASILGCSFEQFKQYIESKWESWMNWDNYGNPKDGVIEPNKTWDLDHIIPIATAKTEDDVIRLNHYTNLQPLCSYDNRFIKRSESDINKN
jgi:hypothetical protein